MHETQSCQLNHHSPTQSGTEHGLHIFPSNCIGYWTISIFIIIIYSIQTKGQSGGIKRFISVQRYVHWILRLVSTHSHSINNGFFPQSRISLQASISNVLRIQQKVQAIIVNPLFAGVYDAGNITKRSTGLHQILYYNHMYYHTDQNSYMGIGSINKSTSACHKCLTVIMQIHV